MNNLSRARSGFAVLETLLLVLVVSIVGAAGYYVWHANNVANNTYDSALKSTINANQSSTQKRTGSNIITVKNQDASIAPEAKSSASASVASYNPYMSIAEWGIKIPTNSKYMGYRWDVSDSSNNLVSVFITDDTDGLSKDVGCAAGSIQGVFVFKDRQNDSDTVMPDANLNIGDHTYYTYKSVCDGSVSADVQKLAHQVTALVEQ